jgi:NAD(P)-dependent dehydrogenase (short-subunit alcohol dehydrogenase family)
MMKVLELFNLKGKVALITGAGSGLGKAFAEAMAEAGARVVCADIDKMGAKATSDDISKLGVESLAMTVDVSKEADVNKMVGMTIRELGRLDILFNTTAAFFIDN